MEDQTQPKPESKEECCTTEHKDCYCKAIVAVLIIILVWWAPSWGNIGITVLAALMILGAGACLCRKKD